MLKDKFLNKTKTLTSDDVYKRAIVIASSPAYRDPSVDPVKLARQLCTSKICQVDWKPEKIKSV